MTEEKKESVVSIAGVNPYPSDKTLITNIKASKTAGLQTYEVYFLIPDSDEESMEQYNCNLRDLIAQGVRNLSTRPPYQLEFEGEELTPEAHARCQDLADNYRCGAKGVGGASMVKIKQAAKSEGMSNADILEAIRLYNLNKNK